MNKELFSIETELSYKNTYTDKRIQIHINESVYLDLSTFQINKIVIYGFWVILLKYREKAKLCLMTADSFIVYIKAEDVYVDTAKSCWNEMSYFKL